MLPPPPRSTLFPYTTLFRSLGQRQQLATGAGHEFDIRGALSFGTQQCYVLVRNYQGGCGRTHVLDGLPENLPQLLRRSEEHTSELQSRRDLVCRLLLEKKKK